MTVIPKDPVTKLRRDDRTSRADVEHVADRVLLRPPEHLIDVGRLGAHKSGQVAMVRRRRNPDGHVVLRGGVAGFDPRAGLRTSASRGTIR